MNIEAIKELIDELQKARKQRMEQLEQSDPVMQNLNGQVYAYSNIINVENVKNGTKPK